MSVLITGGNGFIGSHLAENLIKKDWQPIILDITYTKNTDKLDCTKIKGDICNYGVISRAIQNKDIIVHLAAVSRVEWGQSNPRKCVKVNTLGTLTLLEAVRKKNPKAIVIMGSSREVYGESVSLPVKEDHPKNPISVYGLSKLASERLILTYHSIYGLNYVILRFSNVYGSSHDLRERVIPRFVKLALKNEPLTIYGGQQILDFTFIDDVVEGVVNAVQKVGLGDNAILNSDFNFATGKGTSILELAKLVAKECNSDSKILINEKRDFDVSNFIGDYQKANQCLEYAYKYPLEEGLRIYKQRVKNEGYLDKI